MLNCSYYLHDTVYISYSINITNPSHLSLSLFSLSLPLPYPPPSLSPCLMHTLTQEHTGRVFRLQFDDFQIVSSSHDDTILIWDFLDTVPPGPIDQGSMEVEHTTAKQESSVNVSRSGESLLVTHTTTTPMKLPS